MSEFPLVRLRQVSRAYGAGDVQVRALDSVDLDIEAGDFVAVMGPSGSGKSTTMNIIGCLDTPSTGHYYFRGIDVKALDTDQRALLRRHALGFVFQGFNLLKRTTALENVELPLIYQRVPAAERHARGRAALAQVGLAHRENHNSTQLSGGEQQRVAIARAIVTQPKLLLADEPTGNLDSKRSAEVMELLTSLNRDQGITIVMVTHEPDMAAYARRVVTFLDGRIVTDERQKGVA